MKKLLIGSGILILVGLALHVVFDYGSFTQVAGESMEPAYHDGQWAFTNKLMKPSENDVIIFDCLSKCQSSGESKFLIKRVIKTDSSGCFWVEGDNKDHSFDSRNYGWVCPSDISLNGIVAFAL